MTLETAARLYATAWLIRHPHRPCTDQRARHFIQDARINALTTQDNEQDQ